MMSKAALNGFLERFHGILDELDGIEADEELDELNAQLEDVLFLMESVDVEDADAAEEIAGALEEIDDLLAAYRELAEELPELRQQALELEMARRMAGQNLVLGDAARRGIIRSRRSPRTGRGCGWRSRRTAARRSSRSAESSVNRPGGSSPCIPSLP